MIITFLRERKSWIIVFVLIELLHLFIAFIDSSIPLRSVTYTAGLTLIIFSAFLFYRYQKETKFFQSLQNRENNLDLSDLPRPESVFEQITEKAISDQTAILKQEAEQHFLLLEQEKDDLLSWIHEVKTPLTAMKLMLDRMDEGDLKRHMTYEWLRIHLLLDQQLHQKRLPFMKNDLYVEHTMIEPLIYQELKTLQTWCIQKGIGFDIDLEATEVTTDAKWLAFIIRQLLTNAVKYSQTGDIHITSTVIDDRATLKIEDFGRGISAKDLPRIFDKGFTSTAQHQDHSATGMGLYLAKNAAEALHIDIEVSSKFGRGSSFTLIFPRKNNFQSISGM